MLSNEPVNLAYESYESESGSDEALTPIVFLHGLSSTKKSWAYVAKTLANKTKRKVYAIDARNHGDSPYCEHFSGNLNVKDLFHFLDSKNISKSILVGHSMGGRTAIYAALSKPHRIEKLFVEDMHLKRFPRATIEIILMLLHMRKESTLNMPKGLSEMEAMEFSNDFILNKIPKGSPFYGKLNDIRRGRQDLKRNQDGSYDLNFNYDVVTQHCRNDENLFYNDSKGQYEGPTFFMYGSTSFLNVQNEEENIRKHFPNAKFIEFTGAGHNIHSSFTEEFVAKILSNL